MQIFAKRFWGFDPEIWPLVSFGRDGDRDALVKSSESGDLMAFVGTQEEPTPEELWGKLIGLGQFTHDIVASKQVLAPEVYEASRMATGGVFRWPAAVPVVRAWLFTDRPRPPLKATIGRQFDRTANTRAVTLSAEEQERILSRPMEEVAVFDTPLIRLQRVKMEILLASRPSTGPVPSSWQRFVSHDAETASFTYAFRFGRTGTWKIGHAVDPAARLGEVNAHVPHEVLGYGWTAFLKQRHSTQTHAYEMEQRIFEILKERRTARERLQCSEGDLTAAWLKALNG